MMKLKSSSNSLKKSVRRDFNFFLKTCKWTLGTFIIVWSGKKCAFIHIKIFLWEKDEYHSHFIQCYCLIICNLGGLFVNLIFLYELGELFGCVPSNVVIEKMVCYKISFLIFMAFMNCVDVFLQMVYSRK